jgi:hypothetical protein
VTGGWQGHVIFHSTSHGEQSLQKNPTVCLCNGRASVGFFIQPHASADLQAWQCLHKQQHHGAGACSSSTGLLSSKCAMVVST